MTSINKDKTLERIPSLQYVRSTEKTIRFRSSWKDRKSLKPFYLKVSTWNWRTVTTLHTRKRKHVVKDYDYAHTWRARAKCSVTMKKIFVEYSNLTVCSKYTNYFKCLEFTCIRMIIFICRLCYLKYIKSVSPRETESKAKNVGWFKKRSGASALEPVLNFKLKTE